MTNEHSPNGTVQKAYGTVKDGALKSAEALEGNPLGLLVGGLALGALVGALVPRSDRERDMLAPVGRRLSDVVAQAVTAAREAGRAELDAQGLTKSNAQDRGKDLIDGVLKALTSAGTAAMRSAKPN